MLKAVACELFLTELLSLGHDKSTAEDYARLLAELPLRDHQDRFVITDHGTELARVALPGIDRHQDFRIEGERAPFDVERMLTLASAIRMRGINQPTANWYAIRILLQPRLDAEGRLAVIEAGKVIATLPMRCLEYFELDEDMFYWSNVLASRRDRKFQKRHSEKAAKARYLGYARACPQCAALPGDLAWFYFERDVPPELECGRGGWMTVCDRCRRAVQFMMEWMS